MGDRARTGLHLISTVVRAFAESASDYPRLLQTIVREIAQTIPDTCTVSLRSDDGRTVTASAVYDPDPAVVAAFRSVLGRPRELSDSPLAASAMTSGPLLVPRVDVDELRARFPTIQAALLHQLGVRGLLVVPMRAHGDTFGALGILRRGAEHPPLDELDLEIVEDLAGHAALALGTSRLVARLQRELDRREAAEQALENSVMKLRELEPSVFLDAIIENIPDMVFVKDAQRLAFVRLNRAGEALLGMSRDMLIGKNDFDFFPANEAEFFVAKDRETLASRTLVDIAEEPIHTAGGTRWLHTKKVPLLDPDGVPRYLLGISEDITHRKLAAAKLDAARVATDQTNRELESFTYSVAHDLRGPLRGILGYTRAILEDHGAALPEEATRYLGRVQDSAERMALLIDDLLDLSRVTRAEMSRDRVELSSIAHSIVAGLRAAAPERLVEVVIAPDLLAEGDSRLLAVVLEQLLENAWKFTARRAGARIEVGSLEGDAGRAFFVRDNGAGFDPAFADQLFGVFHRLHRDAEFPGTGIGLAMVARIVHRHHGRVWAEGAVGEGATFYFALGEP